jgi:multidrug efflux pump subunit AcrA (membrane-fusion protein)
VLVKLDDREQRARVALAAQGAASTAELNAAEVRGREAQARLGGTSKAAASGAATSWEVRQAQAAADQAGMEARMARDRRAVEAQRLRLERVMLENYVITAPFDGRVTRMGARVGMTVRKADPVATIVDLAQLRGEAFVPVAHYARLKVGAAYPVVFAAPFGGERRATLAYIDPAIDAGLVRCVFRLDNAAETLPSGLQASIRLAPLAK